MPKIKKIRELPSKIKIIEETKEKSEQSLESEIEESEDERFTEFMAASMNEVAVSPVLSSNNQSLQTNRAEAFSEGTVGEQDEGLERTGGKGYLPRNEEKAAFYEVRTSSPVNPPIEMETQRTRAIAPILPRREFVDFIPSPSQEESFAPRTEQVSANADDRRYKEQDNKIKPRERRTDMY